MKFDMTYGERVTEKFQRDHLADLLTQCKPEQQAVFSLMYPNGVSKADLCWAMTQCKNSLHLTECE